ncbi:MAG: DUF1232 domain-containing protein [Ardenticatenales bacterium]|nr:DUF1232 domain-containing protein [Ardenticatenales bacterium]
MNPNPDSSDPTSRVKDGGAEVRPYRLSEIADQGRLAWRLLRDGRVPAWQKAIPVLTALYLLSPIDVLPEAIIGPFGLVDDFFVVLLALKAFNRLAGPYADGRRAPVVGTDATDDDVSGPTIEVPYRPVSK